MQVKKNSFTFEPSLTLKTIIMTYDDYLDLQDKRKEDSWGRFDYDLTFVIQFEKDGKKQFKLVDDYDTDKAFNQAYMKFGLKLHDAQIIGIFDDNDMNPTTFAGIDINEL